MRSRRCRIAPGGSGSHLRRSANCGSLPPEKNPAKTHHHPMEHLAPPQTHHTQRRKKRTHHEPPRPPRSSRRHTLRGGASSPRPPRTRATLCEHRLHTGSREQDVRAIPRITHSGRRNTTRSEHAYTQVPRPYTEPVEVRDNTGTDLMRARGGGSTHPNDAPSSLHTRILRLVDTVTMRTQPTSPFVLILQHTRLLKRRRNVVELIRDPVNRVVTSCHADTMGHSTLMRLSRERKHGGLSASRSGRDTAS